VARKSKEAANGRVDQLAWKVDRNGYELSADGSRIVRRGGELRTYVPDNEHPSPHYLLANLAGQILQPGVAAAKTGFRVVPFWKRRFSDETAALLAWVNEYGFLGSLESKADALSESVAYISQQRRTLSGFYAFDMEPLPALANTFNAHVAPDLTLRLVEARRGGFETRIVPRSLVAWAWVRVAAEIEHGIRWINCGYCRKPMAIGKGFFREDKTLCSASCRVSDYRRNQRKRSKK